MDYRRAGGMAVAWRWLGGPGSFLLYRTVHTLSLHAFQHHATKNAAPRKHIGKPMWFVVIENNLRLRRKSRRLGRTPER